MRLTVTDAEMRIYLFIFIYQKQKGQKATYIAMWLHTKTLMLVAKYHLN